MNRNDLLFNIVITACEGGVNHWAAVKNYKWNDADLTASATLLDTEDAFKKYDLTYKTIRSGIKTICKPGFQLREDILKNILIANRNNDAGDIDAEAADCIVQAGIFGEIVYG